MNLVGDGCGVHGLFGYIWLGCFGAAERKDTGAGWDCPVPRRRTPGRPAGSPPSPSGIPLIP